ncbi:MAG: hypothetical protein AVDCRST_MAG79-977 [uncultured Thermoleophilia bacterium]|uniref:Uncharacterized protein n=1 Tax=uncultured Thermoleophilia bacterium TaxID=1497501 RepID=A0A6J4TT37_9ACTN|nr:MAG: hypothetical protein AVDCRST_MAG79-977 [uncultured Thermoleophilia bacterium]
MEALDGNAIAGQLMEVFGGEMTTVTGRCAGCRRTWQMAELEVHTHAPGTVGRCRDCGVVLMVLVTARGVTCVHLPGLVDLGMPTAP